mgnify:FL=1
MASSIHESPQSADETEAARASFARFLARQPFPVGIDEQRIAVARFFPVEGGSRSRELLFFDRAHRLLHTRPLVEESPFTAWYAGTVRESWFRTPDAADSPPSARKIDA